jgi:DnaJ-class molecular chaperone
LHPDFRPGDPAAEEAFKALVDALLSLTRGPTPAPPGGEGAPARAPAARGPARGPRSPADVVTEFTVGLGEAVRGGEQTARLRFAVPCPVSARRRGRPTACPTCGGRGTHTIDRRVAFRLPPGTRDGDVLRIGGGGAAAEDGGRGDLRVRLRVRLPPGARIEGDDLHVELPLTLPEALAGTRIDVPAPAGTVSVTVPPGSDGTSILRVRGWGLPAPAGSSRPAGHLFLYPVLRLPPSPLTAEQLRTAAALAAAYPHDVRAGWLVDAVDPSPKG